MGKRVQAQPPPSVTFCAAQPCTAATDTAEEDHTMPAYAQCKLIALNLKQNKEELRRWR